jgi:hypothetical protein
MIDWQKYLKNQASTKNITKKFKIWNLRDSIEKKEDLFLVTI